MVKLDRTGGRAVSAAGGLSPGLRSRKYAAANICKHIGRAHVFRAISLKPVSTEAFPNRSNFPLRAEVPGVLRRWCWSAGHNASHQRNCETALPGPVRQFCCFFLLGRA